MYGILTTFAVKVNLVSIKKMLNQYVTLREAQRRR